MHMRGKVGEFRCGGRWAATLKRWELRPLPTPAQPDGSPSPPASILDYTVKESDPYWLEAGPLTVRLRVGPRIMVWRQVFAEHGRARVEGKPEVQRAEA